MFSSQSPEFASHHFAPKEEYSQVLHPSKAKENPVHASVGLSSILLADDGQPEAQQHGIPEQESESEYLSLELL